MAGESRGGPRGPSRRCCTGCASRESSAFPHARGRIQDPEVEAALRGSGELPCRSLPGRDIPHLHQNPHQAPALSVVAFAGIGAVALEIDVIDQGVGAIGCGGNLPVVGLDARPLACWGGCHDPGQGGSRLGHDEFGLDVDVGREPATEAGERAPVEVALEGGPVVPGAVGKEGRGGNAPDAPVPREPDELGPGFGPAAVKAPRIPDEVPDPERGKLLALVPVREPAHLACRFILPDLHSDPAALGPIEANTIGSVGLRHGLIDFVGHRRGPCDFPENLVPGPGTGGAGCQEQGSCQEHAEVLHGEV